MKKRNRIRGGHDFTGRVRKTVSVRLLFCSSCLRFGVYYTRLTLKHDNPQLQYAPMTRGQRLPSSLISKGFTFSHGKINLEVTLDREIYYHGEKVIATVVVSNSSRKSVKNIKVMQRTTVVRDGHVAFTRVTANNGYRSISGICGATHRNNHGKRAVFEIRRQSGDTGRLSDHTGRRVHQAILFNSAGFQQQRQERHRFGRTS